MPKALKFPIVLAVFAAGVLLAWTLAGSGQAAATTTTTVAAETTTDPAETTVSVETTVPAETTPLETEVEPTTVFTTTTTIVLPPRVTTTGSSEDDEGTPAWVWVLIAILAAGLVALIVLLARRRGGGGVSAGERQLQLDAAVGSWAAQGWTVVDASADSAVLRRGSESMLVSVDEAGRVSTRPLPPS